MTYRTIEADDWIARQPKAVQEAGEARGEALTREVTLRQVREAVRRSQVEVAAAMGTSQDRVSTLERGGDALVSTLRRHVRALGGAAFDGRISRSTAHGHRFARWQGRRQERAGYSIGLMAAKSIMSPKFPTAPRR